MKKKIFIIFLFLMLHILFFCCYKFLIPGNNKHIEDVNDLNAYISSIEDYNAESKVIVNSNKNSNVYNLFQSKHDGISKQEIISAENDNGIIIENVENKMIIKNTQLSVEKVFLNYEDVMKNSVGLDSFIEDYLCDENKEILDKEGYYIISVKSKNSQNKYSLSKTLYFNKEKNEIEKIVVKDINNNETTIIEYIKLEIL